MHKVQDTLPNIIEYDPDDILWGADEIGAVVNITDRKRVFYLLGRGHLPGKKVGRSWISSRKLLRQAMTVTE
jgi:hypothetical protein